MTEEDEEFNRIEREAAMRKEAVMSAISKEQKEYERGFVDGMQEQMRRSVDKAVNAMTRRTWLDMTTREQIARHVEQMGMNGYGTLAIAAAIRSMDLNAEEREWVGLTDEEVDEAARYCVKSGQSVNAAIRAIATKLKEKNDL